MGWAGTNVKRRGRGWPAIGLVLTLLFIGHDLLMTLPAHAADVSPAHASGHGAMTHGTTGDVVVPESAHPATGHPRECGILTVAAPWLGQRLGLDSASGAVLDQAGTWSLPRLVRSGAVAWDQPHAPPGVRRALLQVYLM